MSFLLLIPAILSFLIAAAHWLRSGNLLFVLVCLAAPFVMLGRSRWIAPIVQVMLVGISLEWIRTTLILTNERQEYGEPWRRMAAILLSVAAVALIAALLFFTPPLKRRYGNTRIDGSAPLPV